MPELLLEVGCEELPASSVRRACDQLRDALAARMGEALLEPSGGVVYGTPRRLIVSFASVADRQPDVVKEVRGPSAQAAYDGEGKPSKALEGFCRGQGVDPGTARVEGDYVYVTKSVIGRPATEVLAELIPEAIRSLTFDKTMRWAGYRMRFARPIRWILASLGGTLVPFTLEGITSGLQSRGHRFNHPEPFECTAIDSLLAELRVRQVEADADIRTDRIRSGISMVAGELAIADGKLIEENAFLTEWPSAVGGEFDPRFLELPGPVLTTVMAKHERFFPVRNTDGGLSNRFVSIRNSGVDDVVAAGNAWVLNCRFNDAKFFFDEDAKLPLSSFLEKTEGIVFQAELGTVRSRARRLERLAGEIALHTGAGDDEVAFARQAGLYAKADLSTGLVGELDELQGVIGGLYARREGFPDAVCWAISSHYDPGKNLEPGCEGARTAMRLVLADQLDKLAGYLGLGLVPSGSSDPFGLRRAAGVAMENALRWDVHVDLSALLTFALAGYERPLDAVAALAAAREVFRQRCDTLFPEARTDVLDAVLANESLVFRPQELKRRLELMAFLSLDTPFVQAATRPLNIVAAAEKKGIMAQPLERTRLDSPAGDSLLALAESMADDADLRTLQAPIDAFFDSTMVMVEDEAVRDARLAMLRIVSGLLLNVGDFSKLVIPG